MKKQIFGTDGIRCKAGTEMLTADKCLHIGKAIAYGLKHKESKEKTTIIVGKDTRVSGTMIENAFIAGACSAGANVLYAGIMPTPAIAYLTKTLKADIGVVISASHNSFEDNGIKFFSNEGLKLPDNKEAEIEVILRKNSDEIPTETGSKIGTMEYIEDAEERYINFLLESCGNNFSLKNLKIVLDCANGAGYSIAPKLFARLGAELITINDTPDGININEECGATETKALQKQVLEAKADIGIALDGDADRLICVDEKGNEVDGDTIIGLCALDLKKRDKLTGNRVIITIMSNIGLEISLKENDINILRTNVGDRYVIEEMLKTHAVLGGEASGHLIFTDFNTTGDGIMAALQMIKILKAHNKPFSEMAQKIKKYPQLLTNLLVKEKRPLDMMPRLEDTIAKCEKQLGDRGRILVRYSGTENKIRIMSEGDNMEELQQINEEIAGAVNEEIGL